MTLRHCRLSECHRLGLCKVVPWMLLPPQRHIQCTPRMPGGGQGGAERTIWELRSPCISMGTSGTSMLSMPRRVVAGPWGADCRAWQTRRPACCRRRGARGAEGTTSVANLRLGWCEYEHSKLCSEDKRGPPNTATAPVTVTRHHALTPAYRLPPPTEAQSHSLAQQLCCLCSVCLDGWTRSRLPPPPCRDGTQAHVRIARVGGGVPRWHKT